jgi:hypothetical protein
LVPGILDSLNPVVGRLEIKLQPSETNDSGRDFNSAGVGNLGKDLGPIDTHGGGWFCKALMKATFTTPSKAAQYRIRQSAVTDVVSVAGDTASGRMSGPGKQIVIPDDSPLATWQVGKIIYAHDAPGPLAIWDFSTGGFMAVSDVITTQHFKTWVEPVQGGDKMWLKNWHVHIEVRNEQLDTAASNAWVE